MNDRPIRFLQFGAGNFLRAFTDWMIAVLQEETDFRGDVCVVKPTPRGDYHELREQQGRYHVLLNGIVDGTLQEELKEISCIQQVIQPYQAWGDFLATSENPELRFIISNTTESGIRFNSADVFPEDQCPQEFPAKLCAWLWHRYTHFKGAADKGCILLPLELIEDNGAALKAVLLEYAQLWQLDQGFITWLNEHNTFCNTLVDRIVSGYPEARAEEIHQRIGWEDKLLVAGEWYHSWIIEAPDFVAEELPFSQTQLQVKFVDSLDIHRQIKVRILNGAHTAMVPVGLLAGRELVSEAIEDAAIGPFIQHLLHQEVIPHISYDQKELEKFAEDVIARFQNPHIRHKLISISLNSTSKYCTRLLPSLLDYVGTVQKLPPHIVFALASLICLYRGNWADKSFALKDREEVLDFFKESWNTYGDQALRLSQHILSNTDIWGQDLSAIQQLDEAVAGCISLIETEDMSGALQQMLMHITPS